MSSTNGPVNSGWGQASQPNPQQPPAGYPAANPYGYGQGYPAGQGGPQPPAGANYPGYPPPGYQQGQQPFLGQQPAPGYGQPVGYQPIPTQQWAGQGGMGQPPKKPWFRQPGGVVAIILAVVLLIGGFMIMRALSQRAAEPLPNSNTFIPSNSAQTNDPSAEESNLHTPAPPMDSVQVFPKGSTATVGGWEYTVVSVTEAATIGSGGFEYQAAGKYVIVKLDIKNVNSELTLLSGSALQLNDGNSTYYEDLNSWAALDDGLLIESVDPGTSVTRSVAFDLPSDSTPKALAASDSIQEEWVYVEI